MISEKWTTQTSPFPDVFLSYRRQEASYLAAWLHDSLAQHLGPGRVFLDIDCIKPGTDFIDSIELALRHAAVALVIIGSKWLTDENGIRRIDALGDPVRLEIEYALKQGITVLPVLLDDAMMPGANDLPPSVASLTRINSVRIRRDSARSDLLALLHVVEDIIPHASANGTSAAPGPLPEIESREVRSQPRTNSIGPEVLRKQRQRLLLQLENLYTERVEAVAQLGVSFELVFEFAPEKIFRAGDQFLTSPRRAITSAVTRGVVALLDSVGSRFHDGLLILGSAGSGKTSSMHEIGQHLLGEIRGHDDRPLPVYLHLSTWVSRRGALWDWAVGQLHEMYQVPTSLARRWIESGGLLLLLDGLDEISDPVVRTACAREINTFHRFGSQVSTPILVACRTEEYDALGLALNLGSAVVVHPLDPEVVRQQLAQASPPLAGDVSGLIENSEYRNLLRSPLLVTMLLSLASTGDQSQTQTAYERPMDLIAGYLPHRLELERRRNISRRNAYPPELTRRWLSNLARNIDQSHRTVFLPDRIPSTWLPSRRARRLVLLLVPTLWGAVLGLAFATALALAARRGLGSSFDPFATTVSFTSVGFVAALLHRQRLYLRCASWLAFGMSVVILMGLLDDSVSALPVLTGGLLYATFFGLVGELAVALLGGEMDPVEHLSFSWTSARKTVPRLCLAGVVVGIGFSLGNWLPSGLDRADVLLVGVVFGLMLGAVFGLALALRRGIQMTLIPIRIRPHEGLNRSVRYGSVIGLCSCAIVGVTFFVSGLLVGPEIGLVRGIAWGPAVGSLLALATGLGAVVQYWTRRLLLWRAGVAPLRYTRWLEYAVALRILYRSGGGYVFIHGVLQDWLAREPLSEAPEESRSS